MNYEYGDQLQPSTSKSTIKHKFFERTLSNDVVDLSTYLLWQYSKVESGELFDGKNEVTAWDESGSESTRQWNRYNAFQFMHPAVHNLYQAVKEMTQEACQHYGLNFEKEQFYTQSWFNVNHKGIGKLDWHEHGGDGAPWFHGYYCVNAEPTKTHYRVFGEEIDNVNRNNRAILSETGHPHAMADWDWEGPRITMAYDVLPLRALIAGGHPDGHWVPLV